MKKHALAVVDLVGLITIVITVSQLCFRAAMWFLITLLDPVVPAEWWRTHPIELGTLVIGYSICLGFGIRVAAGFWEDD